MKANEKIIDIISKNKGKLENKYFVRKIGIFGSYSKDCHNKSSDIDILVEFLKPIGWEIIDLKIFLEEILKLEVDLVTPNALKTRIKDKILNDVIFI